MSLRARLVLAFFLLAVVPLTGLTLFSYLSSERAFRKAADAEAQALAQDMSTRLDAVTADLSRRIAELPLGGAGGEDGLSQDMVQEIERRMGSAASLLESLEFIPGQAPAAPRPPGAPAARVEPAPPAPPVPAAPGVPRAGPPPRALRNQAEAGLVILPPPPGQEGDQGRWIVRPRHLEEMKTVERELQKALEQVHSSLRPGDTDEQRREAVRIVADLQREAAQQLRDHAREIAEATRQAVAEAQKEALSRMQEQVTAQEEKLREEAEAREEALREEEEREEQDAAAAARGTPSAEARVRAREEAKARARQQAEAARAQARRAHEEARAQRQAARARRELAITLGHGGRTLGTVRAHVREEQVISQVLGQTRRNRGEVPFAVDAEGKLQGAPEDLAKLKDLPLARLAQSDGEPQALGDWVVAGRKDPETGLLLGIARPVREPLREIRRAAMLNLAGGLALIGVAMVGIIPISRRMTRDLDDLAVGAEKLAKGDLDTRVPVRSQDEFGRLSETFNRMASDLKLHQEQLLEQERIHKELEMGRRIQQEMLPRERLKAPFAEVKGVSVPANEVGGDFFNYFVLPDHTTALLLGDVSGKGVGAALLMANVQALLRARLPLESDLAVLAEQLDHEINQGTPLSAYLTLFLAVLDGEKGVLRYVNAGQNPPFLLRADGRAEALDPSGRPLGLMPGGGYEVREVPLGPGDSLFVYTDGVVESENREGEAFGMERLQDILVRERATGLDDVLSRVEDAVRAFRGGAEAADDATMVVLKFGPQYTQPA